MSKNSVQVIFFGGVPGRPDAIRDHQGSTLRLKGTLWAEKNLRPRPAFGGRWRVLGGLDTIRDRRLGQKEPFEPKKNSAFAAWGPWRVLGRPDTIRDHQGSTLRSKGTVWAKKNMRPLEAAGGAWGSALWVIFFTAGGNRKIFASNHYHILQNPF